MHEIGRWIQSVLFETGLAWVGPGAGVLVLVAALALRRWKLFGWGLFGWLIAGIFFASGILWAERLLWPRALQVATIAGVVAFVAGPAALLLTALPGRTRTVAASLMLVLCLFSAAVEANAIILLGAV